MRTEENIEDHLTYVKERNFNDSRYSVLSDKLESLGWQKETQFEDGLVQTIDWYIKNPAYWGADSGLYEE